MLTPEEIEELVRQEHADFKVGEGDLVTIITPESDPDEYERMVQERVQWRLAQQERDDEQAVEDARAEAIKQRYAALKAGTATSAQVQQVVAHLLRERYRDLAP